jgi:hypothetical protein
MVLVPLGGGSLAMPTTGMRSENVAIPVHELAHLADRLPRHLGDGVN